MTGIYKILSPTGKVYIGQSLDIKKRWRAHVYNVGRSKLLNSLRKHGNSNHVFSIVHELPKDVTQDVLNIYEQIYIDAYRDLGIDLLNLREGGSRGTHSLETRKIISEKGMGRRLSEKHKAAISLLHKGHKYNLGRKQTEEHKQKIRLKQKGRVHTLEHNKKVSESKSGDKCYMYGIDPSKHPQAKKIRCTKTDIVYGTITEAARALGLKRNTLSMCLIGKNKNKTTLVYDTQ